MKRYSEYKDSGVKWIGKIPNHWEVKNWKHITEVLTDYTANGSFGDLAKNVQYLDYKDYARLVRLTDIRDDCKNEGIYVTEKAYRYLSKSKLNGGEFLIANVGAYSGLICEMPYLEEKATLGPNMMMAKFNKEIDNKFMIYVGNSSYSQMQLKDRANSSSAQPKLNKDDFRSIVIATPTLKEQKQIVSYLDKKTSQIEKLISKKEGLIEILKASRTKLISETVTKGLDKDVPMKDSGIEWIGQIPSHYEIKKLKNLCTHIGRGKSPEYEENTGDYTVNQACLYWNYFKSESIKSVANKFYNSLNANQKINKGDILINSTGGGNLGKSAFFDKTGTLGRVHFYEGEEKYAYDSHVTMIRLKESFNKKYFYYMFCTKNVHSYIDLFCVNGSTKQIELSKTGLESIVIPVPSKKEQDEISKYLDEKTVQIDVLIETIEEQIKLLKKAKQKLITEVVTGKIDVTNL